MASLNFSVSLLRRSVTNLRLVANSVPRASIHERPAKDPNSALDQTIALTVMVVGMIGPSAWIMAHLEDYKKRD